MAKKKAVVTQVTEALEFFKYNPETDGDQTFNIDKALNENWDKVKLEFEKMGVSIDGLKVYKETLVGTIDFNTYTKEGVYRLNLNLQGCTNAPENVNIDGGIMVVYKSADLTAQFVVDHVGRFASRLVNKAWGVFATLTDLSKKADKTNPVIEHKITMRSGANDIDILKYNGTKDLSIGAEGSGTVLRVNNNPVAYENHNHNGTYAMATNPDYIDNPNSFTELRAYQTTTGTINPLPNADGWSTILNIPGFRPIQIGYNWNEGSKDLYYRTSSATNWSNVSKNWTRIIDENYLINMGRGKTILSEYGKNLNDFDNAGKWFVVNCSNTPDGTNHGLLEVYKFPGTGFDPDGQGSPMVVVFQRFTQYSNGKTYTRTRMNSNTWSSWTGGGGVESVQRGVVTASGTVTISSINTSKAFLNLNRKGANSSASGSVGLYGGHIVSSTQIQIDVPGNYCSGVNWEVVEYNQGGC